METFEDKGIISGWPDPDLAHQAVIMYEELGLPGVTELCGLISAEIGLPPTTVAQAVFTSALQMEQMALPIEGGYNHAAVEGLKGLQISHEYPSHPGDQDELLLAKALVSQLEHDAEVLGINPIGVLPEETRIVFQELIAHELI